MHLQVTDWVTCKQWTFISHSSGGWKSKIRVPPWLSDSLLPGDLLYPPKVEGRKAALWGSFLVAPIPFIRVPPSWPNYLSNTLLPNTISLRVRIQYMNLGRGDTNGKSIPVYMGLSSLQGEVSQGLGRLIIYLFILSIWYNTCCRVGTPDIWHLQGLSIQHHQL